MGKEIFVVFPYLNTSKPVHIRGFCFRNSKDATSLSKENSERLVEISQMFFLRDDIQITEVTYSFIDLSESFEKNQKLLGKLRQAQLLISYIYCSPNNTWSTTFLNNEHSNIFIFEPASVSKFQVYPSVENQPLKDLSDIDPFKDISDMPSSLVDGYNVTLNWQHWFSTIKGNRIYPTVPDFWINISQDLYQDIEISRNNNQSWAFFELFHRVEARNLEIENRLFTALHWYNLSTSLNLPHDLSLVNLAIAFESLLNLEQDRDLVKRFKEMIVNMLGNIPRLDSWVEQFYKARSGIVHDGSWPHLMYYPIDLQNVADIYKGKRSEIEYLPLISYGWRVFRICFNIILSGANLAQNANLGASLISNQERLEEICKKLSEKDLKNQENIDEISALITDLEENYAFSKEQVRIETLLSIAKSLITLCLEENTDLPEPLTDGMNKVITGGKDIRELVENTFKLKNELNNWSKQQAENLSIRGPRTSLFSLFQRFNNYMVQALVFVKLPPNP